MVQTNTAVFPGSDAGVLRIRGVSTGIALTTDCNARYVYLDPCLGAKMAAYEAARNLVCSGAKPVAVTDCLNFGNPEKPDAFWQFQEAVRGLADACEELGTPVVSGNVSFYNETPESAIYPTPVIGMLGVMDDVEKRLSAGFRGEGDSILLLRAAPPDDAWSSLAGSELQMMLKGEIYGEMPCLGEQKQLALNAAVLEMSGKGMLRSAHDVSDGGLVVALSESCIAGGMGAEVNLTSAAAAEPVLYGERAGDILVSVEPDRVEAVRAIAHSRGLTAEEIGKTGTDAIRVAVNGQQCVSVALTDAAAAYNGSIGAIMDSH